MPLLNLTGMLNTCRTGQLGSFPKLFSLNLAGLKATCVSVAEHQAEGWVQTQSQVGDYLFNLFNLFFIYLINLCS